ITTAAMFLGDNYDFIVQTHLNKGGSPCMYERFEGALEHAYKGKSGSIYKLSADGFMEESAISSGELVSEEETDVIEEIEVEDALEYLENLEAEGKLRIYRYPEIPEGFPKD